MGMRYRDAVNERPKMTLEEAKRGYNEIHDDNMTLMEFYDNHRELAEYSIKYLGGLRKLNEITNDRYDGKVIAGLEAERPEVAKVVRKKYKPCYANARGIQREIIRLWYVGSPLNYTAVAKKRVGLHTGAKTFFGSWENAVTSVGIDYTTVMKGVSSNVLSECGTEFETLFAEILTELNYAYIREGEGLNDVLEEGFALKPDFILPNWRWLDCKLSEWTDASEMLKKYQAFEPNGISIVYLRGRKQRKQRGKKWRYEHVSVYCFTEQLTQDRRKYYEDKLNEIAIKADEGAIAN